MSECVCTHTIYSMSLLLNLVDSASIVYIRPYRYIAHYKMGKNWIYRSLFTIRSDQMSKFTFMYTHYPVASVGCPQSIKTQHTKLVDSFWQWSILQINSTTCTSRRFTDEWCQQEWFMNDSWRMQPWKLSCHVPWCRGTPAWCNIRGDTFMFHVC